MWIADASVGFKWFVRESDSDLAMRLLTPGIPVAAPDLIIPECANALKKRLTGEMPGPEMPPDILDDMFRKFPEMLDDIAPTMPLAPRAVRLAMEMKHKMFDCFYLALAIRREAPVVTADRKFIAAARRAGYGKFIVHLKDAAKK